MAQVRHMGTGGREVEHTQATHGIKGALVGEDGAPRIGIRLRELALAWTVIAFIVAEATQAEWIAALAVPFGVVLFLVGWAVRVPDRTQKIKKWIVVGFTVCAYLMQAPIYAERPYEAVGHWIGLFSLESSPACCGFCSRTGEPR